MDGNDLSNGTDDRPDAMRPPSRPHPFRRFTLFLTAALLILLTALAIWGPAYIENLLNRQDLGALFSEATGGRFTSGKLRFHFFPVPHAVIPEGRVTIPGRLEGQWKAALIYPAYTALLAGKFPIDEVVLENPDLRILMPPADEDASLPEPAAATDYLRQLWAWSAQAAALPELALGIQDGTLSLDGVMESTVRLERLDLDLQSAPDALEIDLQCRSNMWKRMRLQGTLRPADLQGALHLSLQEFDPSLLSRRIPIGKVRWTIRPLNISATADLVDIDRARATLVTQTRELILQGRSAPVSIKGLRLETSLDCSPEGFRIDLAALTAERPSLSIAGQVLVAHRTPLYRIDLTGRQLDIAPLRQAALAVAGNDEIVAGIFDVLRGGRVPRIRFSTQGREARELADFHRMTIDGTVEQGRLFIPEAELDLSAVSGKADIAHGILKGSALKAACGQTMGTEGRLWLDLGQEEDVPFFLEIDVLADLAPLPALLQRWVEDPAFDAEMRRIRSVDGTAEGRLVLDGREGGLDVTADVARCRFEAEYDRLPAPLSINEGMVQYTDDRIQAIAMSGRIGTTQFKTLTGQIAFGDIPLLQVDTGTARLDLQQVVPWLAANGALDALPFRLQSDAGWIDLDQMALHGPLLDPGRWRVDARGTLKHLTFLAKGLPGPAAVASARFRTSPAKLEISRAHVLMADTDLTITEAALGFEGHRPSSGSLKASGHVGEAAGNWIGDLISLEKPWRLKAPVTVSSAALAWTAEGEQSFEGKLTTGGGTRLSLDLQMAEGRLRHQALVVDDQDSHAELRVTFAPETLAIDFDGRFDSTTLARMMQAETQNSGRMEGRFQARIFPRHPGRSTVDGVLRAYDIDQPLRLPQAHYVKVLSLEARNNRLQIAPAEIVVENQTHHLTGSIGIEDDGYVLDLIHAATNLTLPLPDPAFSGERPSPEKDTLSVWDLPLRGRIVSRLDTLTLGPLQWAPFNATVRLDAGSWHGHIDSAAICGISTRGEVRMTPDSLSVALTPETRDQSFDRTMTCLLEKPNLIDGRFDLTGRLEAEGPATALDRAVHGGMALTATKGRIYRFNLLSKALAVVNLTEIFRGKLPDLMKDGLAYERIAIKVDIEDSLCTIREAVIDGASANIAGQGTIDLTTGRTDMIVLVAPFKTVDALVRYTPIIGDWLGGTLISIPVRVTGAFSDPTVTPLSPTAVGSSLMNLMKRTIGLPIKLVEPLWKRNE